MTVRDIGVRVDVDANTSGASGKLGKFAGVARTAALGAAAVGAAAVVGAAKLYEIGNRADDSNARIRNITAQMNLFGRETDKVSNRLIDYANKQALITGVDQNAIKATQAKLLTFKDLASSADTVGGAFDRATIAAVDLAAAGFGTAEGNAVQLGKALNDPINGLASLTKSGITFTASEKERIATLVESNKIGEAQAMILKAIETQVGGTAEATSGGLDRMKIKFSQLAEEIGLKLVPIIDKVADFIVKKAIPAVSRWAAEMREKLGPTLNRIGTFITERVVPAAQSLFRWFVDKLVPGIRDTLAPVLEGARDAFNRIKGSISDNSENLDKLRGWLSKIVEFVVTKVGPIYGKYLKKQFETAGVAISFLITFISSLVGWLESAYSKVVSLIDKIGELKDKASGGGLGIPGLGLLGTVIGRRSASSISPAPRAASNVVAGGTSLRVYASGMTSAGDIAREVRGQLLADARRTNRPGSNLYRPDLGWV